MQLRIRTFALFVLTLALTAFAGEAALAGGKPGGGSTTTSTLAVVVVSSPYNDGQPHHDGTITFDVHTTATDRPYVALSCSQSGGTVYSASAGFFADYPWPSDKYMTLSSTQWTSGAADCTANLWYWYGKRQKTLATTTFHADA